MNHIETLLNNSGWLEPISEYFSKEQMKQLSAHLRHEYINHRVSPGYKNTFKAFELTPFNSVKVTLIGERPSQNHGADNGLFLGTQNNQKIKLLKDVLAQLARENLKIPAGAYSLTGWAEQGVFLLNRRLTTRLNNSTQSNDLYLDFTDAVLNALQNRPNPSVFVTFSEHCEVLNRFQNAHLNYFNPDFSFQEINAILSKYKLEPINWQQSDNLGENEYVRFFRAKSR